jgi:2-amino-4-hydroxy-6-hydroxymethyldihydropteridine diphosphokinase
MTAAHPRDVTDVPEWALVKKKRKKHIRRVTALLVEWADAMGLDPAERTAWIDAGRFHDGLRDAPVEVLRALAESTIETEEILHGPAAATLLERNGETRRSVLDAIQFHSIGSDHWDRVGKALYMADYLEPGRKFDRERRAELAARVPASFDETFREIVKARMAYAEREGFTIYPESAALLASVQ